MNRLYFILFIFIPVVGFAQVGINKTTPEGILDLGSSTTGLVYPVVALSSTATQTISNPAGGSIVAGTTIYNSATVDNGANSVYPGLYFWDGTSWVAQYEKNDNKLFIQDTDLRTGSDDLSNGIFGDQTISFDNNTFTPVFNGPYKIMLTVHYGGGRANLPSAGTQFVNFVEQQGDFDFTFNGTTHTINLSSYSANNNDKISNGGSLKEYINEYNQITYTVEETLTRGTPYTFSLTFNQEFADGFEGDGDISIVPAGDGRGYITINNAVRCTVEINYMGE